MTVYDVFSGHWGYRLSPQDTFDNEDDAIEWVEEELKAIDECKAKNDTAYYEEREVED